MNVYVRVTTAFFCSPNVMLNRVFIEGEEWCIES